MENKADRLSFRYTEETVFDADTTLFAVWQANDAECAAPAVSVSQHAIEWDAIASVNSYLVTIVAPDDTVIRNAQPTTSTTIAEEFTQTGVYRIEVSAATAGGSAIPGATAVRYFVNNALPRVSDIRVLAPDTLVFRGAEGAQKYLITVDCGNDDHVHTLYDNGSSLYFNFSDCDMQEGGIRFTIRATANGYAPSEATFVYERHLDAVTGVAVQDDVLTWNAVAGASFYNVTINGTTVPVSGTSLSLKDRAAAKYEISVVPVARGFNSPAAATLSYQKNSPALPGELLLDGTTLSWNAAEGVTYSIVVNGKETAVEADASSVDLSSLFAWASGSEYTLQLKAAQGANSALSDPFVFRYDELGSVVNYANGVLSWEPVAGALGYEIRFNGDEEMRLTSVTLPENLQFIEDSAFYCSGLTSIILPDSVSEIGDSAFQNCASLTSVNLTADSQLSSIGADAFYGCFNLASITLPDSLQSIGLTAFYNTALTSITLPKNLTDIASRAFDYCLSLAEIKVAEGNTSFVAEENVLFKLSEQDDPSNPSDPRKIELILYPAKKTGTSYTVPDTVTTIAANAFPNASLTSVVLPASVTAIGEMAFSDTGLTTVTVWATTPPTLANAALPDDLNIYVPASAVETYKANAAWCSFAKQISAIPDAGTTYAVTVEPSDGGTASASPTAAIEGAEITLTATPDTGYHFKEWQVVSGNITINDNKFTMPAEAVTVKAVFEQHSSTGTWQSDVNGHWKVCDSCGAKIQEATHTAATDDGDCTTAILCTVCGYTMTAAQSGHDYQWTSNQDGTHSGQCTHSGCNQQITNQSCDYEDGKCTLCGYEEITVTADPQSVTVTEGETAAFTVTATGSNIASYQWQISTDGGSNWTDIAGATGASYTIENTTTAMSGNQYRCVVSNSGDSDTSSAATLTVDPEQYTLTVELNGGSGSATGGSYPAGELIQIDAGTRPNYRFDGWTSSNGGTFADADSASTTFTMPAADTTITAQWEKITSGGGGGGPVYDSYTISASAGEGGTISPSGKISVREGRDQTFTITPANGYVISDVRVDGVSVSKVTSYTFENVRKRHTIEAVFAKENPETGVDNPFTDVHTGDWFYDDVMFVYENGLMIGTSDTTFSPNEAISRAQVAVIFYRMAGSPEVTGESAFTDVVNGPGTAWYYNAVLWAQQNGIVSGYGDDTFRPNDNITREQLAVIFYNYARYKGYDVSATDDLSGFTDAGDVSGWAQEAVQWAVGSSLLNGKGNGILDPKGTATRAEVAAMLCSFIENNQLVPPADTPDEGSGVTGPGNTGSTGGGQGWTQQTTSPQTGDSSSLGLWISLCALSLAGLVGTSIWYAARRRRYETEASSHPLIP